LVPMPPDFSTLPFHDTWYHGPRLVT
jgi:hypothetical protein